MAAALSRSFLERALSNAQRAGVPLVLRLVTRSGRTITLRGVLVSEVATDHAAVVRRSDRRCFRVTYDSLLAVERVCGRPWRPRCARSDGREELADRADDALDRGGLE